MAVTHYHMCNLLEDLDEFDIAHGFAMGYIKTRLNSLEGYKCDNS